MAPKATSLIWNYYIKENINFAKCKACSKKLLTKSSNTKGLWVHLKAIHHLDNIEIEKLVNAQKIQKSNENESIRKETYNNNEAQPTLKQMFVKKEKYESTHSKQKKFDSLIVDYLTEGNFPAFSSVETEGFQNLFELADSKLTVKSRFTYSRRVEEKHKKHNVRSARHCCIMQT